MWGLAADDTRSDIRRSTADGETDHHGIHTIGEDLPEDTKKDGYSGIRDTEFGIWDGRSFMDLAFW
jgi:hypothetical protein